jgi:hypothetical protein
MNQLTLEAISNPNPVVPGEKTAITVIVRDDGRIVVPGATVTITAGGGRFLPEPNTRVVPGRLPQVTGETNQEGRFVTDWVELVNPGAPRYELDIEAAKIGFTSGKAGLLIEVR